ncbi:LamG domain-containing protein, partial [Streptomyces sp. N2-109]
VSATGDEQSAFTVGFVPDPAAPGGAGLWQMGMSGSDSDKPARSEAGNAGFFYDVREWNHLTLVYDGFAKQARLYVNGSLQEVACTDADGDGDADDPECAEAIPWAENVLSFRAGEPLQFGRGKGNGSWVQHWPGAIDDVWTFQGALSEPQVQKLADEWFDLPTEVPTPE